ncbi:hypothetical protein J6590_057176 [Homalodisca vitripennis]|nr:hypothetical protein J6590_057176 [Homalodisca vitripennis]
MAEVSKAKDLESELEIAGVQILYMTEELYRLSSLCCLIRSSQRLVIHEDGQNNSPIGRDRNGSDKSPRGKSATISGCGSPPSHDYLLIAGFCRISCGNQFLSLKH